MHDVSRELPLLTVGAGRQRIAEARSPRQTKQLGMSYESTTLACHTIKPKGSNTQSSREGIHRPKATKPPQQRRLVSCARQQGNQRINASAAARPADAPQGAPAHGRRRGGGVCQKRLFPAERGGAVSIIQKSVEEEVVFVIVQSPRSSYTGAASLATGGAAWPAGTYLLHRSRSTPRRQAAAPHEQRGGGEEEQVASATISVTIKEQPQVARHPQTQQRRSRRQ